MHFGKKFDHDFRLELNGTRIEWVSEWKYLGVVLKSGTVFNCSITDRVKSFYRSLNGILRVEGQSDDLIMLRLIEAHCLPILTYAIEIIHVVHRDERRSLRVAYNSIYRRIFRYRMFESVSNLQRLLGHKTWEELVEFRCNNFLKRARSCPTSSLVRSFCWGIATFSIFFLPLYCFFFSPYLHAVLISYAFRTTLKVWINVL